MLTNQPFLLDKRCGRHDNPPGEAAGLLAPAPVPPHAPALRLRGRRGGVPVEEEGLRQAPGERAGPPPAQQHAASGRSRPRSQDRVRDNAREPRWLVHPRRPRAPRRGEHPQESQVQDGVPQGAEPRRQQGRGAREGGDGDEAGGASAESDGAAADRAAAAAAAEGAPGHGGREGGAHTRPDTAAGAPAGAARRPGTKKVSIVTITTILQKKLVTRVVSSVFGTFLGSWLVS